MKLWHYLALTLLCLALHLPGQMSLPPFDRDESRFAQASRQMVETGDIIDIRLQEEPRYKKPIGIYWLQAASVKLTGVQDQIWAYRLPSLLAALCAVLLTASLGARTVSPLAGMIAGAVLASTLLVGVEARMAKTDATLLATITAMQVLLAHFWLDKTLSMRKIILFWVLIGFGILIKGPPLLLVLAGTLITLSVLMRSGQWLKALRPGWGIWIVLAMVLPWLIVITIKSAGSFWVESVGKDLMYKALAEQESHGALPGYYVLTSLLTFWPWAPLLILAGLYGWQQRRVPLVQFLLAWILPYWVVYELFPTKLLHYTMPVYPALALLLAMALTDRSFAPPVWLKRAALALMGIMIVVVAAALPLAPVAIFAAMSPEPQPDWAAAFNQSQLSFLAVGAGLLLVAASVVAYSMRGRNPKLAVAVGFAALINFYAAIHGSLLPSLDALWVSRQAAQLIEPHKASCPGPVISVGYQEPSLVFTLGTKTELPVVTPATASGPECQLLLVGQRELRMHKPENALGVIHGFNYSKGDAVTLYLFRLDGVTP